MSNVCSKCGRGVMVGHNVSHAKNHTRKMSFPNLHKVSLAKGQPSVKLCSGCLRSLKTVPAV